jgi:hypothetical protein
MVRPERFVRMSHPHQAEVRHGEYLNDRGDPVEWIGPAGARA